ncbi:unnamed protein product [Urochloa decumbens]|uniref:VQ domain-containing protein n=1 Tax=Urochloa decumbens TaxID=240449 RepID=A0ABC8ZZ49_9POAL
MDGVKVTYIETRFVTSDAAGFKDLVQRLTGRSPTAAAAPAPAAPHRPRACRAAATAAAGTRGYYYQTSSPAAHVADGRLAPPPCQGETVTYGIGDFSGLLYGSASQNAQCAPGGSHNDYFPC